MKKTLIKVGSKVASKYAENEAYHWHGTVVKTYTSQFGVECCLVDWEERKRLNEKGDRIHRKSVITSRIEDLRVIG